MHRALSVFTVVFVCNHAALGRAELVDLTVRSDSWVTVYGSVYAGNEYLGSTNVVTSRLSGNVRFNASRGSGNQISSLSFDGMGGVQTEYAQFFLDFRSSPYAFLGATSAHIDSFTVSLETLTSPVSLAQSSPGVYDGNLLGQFLRLFNPNQYGGALGPGIPGGVIYAALNILNPEDGIYDFPVDDGIVIEPSGPLGSGSGTILVTDGPGGVQSAVIDVQAVLTDIFPLGGLPIDLYIHVQGRIVSVPEAGWLMGMMLLLCFGVVFAKR